MRRNEIWLKLDLVQQRANTIEEEGYQVETRRIAADKDREYVLVKNKTGTTWTLEGKRDQLDEEEVEEQEEVNQQNLQARPMVDGEEEDDLLDVWERTAKENAATEKAAVDAIDNRAAKSPPPSGPDMRDLLLQQWIDLMPDQAHLQAYLKDCVFTRSTEDLIDERNSVLRKIGKASDDDSSTIRRLEFQKEFLEDVLEMRQEEFLKGTGGDEEGNVAVAVAVAKDAIPPSTLTAEKATKNAPAVYHPAPSPIVQPVMQPVMQPVLQQEASSPVVKPENIAPKAASPGDQKLIVENVVVAPGSSSPPKPIRIDDDDEPIESEPSVVSLDQVDGQPRPMEQPFLAVPATTESDDELLQEIPSVEELLVQREQQEEDDLFAQEEQISDDMEQENEEFVRFVADVSHRPITEVQADLNRELDALRDMHRRETRDASALTSDMIQDVQVW